MDQSLADDAARDDVRARLIGIGLMIAACSSFAILDSTAKLLVRTYAVGEVVFMRYLLALLYVGAALWWTSGGTLSLRTNKPWLQLTRGLLLVTSTGFNVWALQYLQLAQTSAINFSNPIWVCALSVPLLGERVGPRRWAAVIAGFIGVLIIMRPGSVSFHWAMLLSLFAVSCGAIYNLVTRMVAPHDRAEVSLFYAMAVGALAASPGALIDYQLPTLGALAIMLLMASSGAIGHHLLIEAHRLAPAAVLAPFIYTQIAWMILAGYLLFGDVPDAWTLVGAAVVVASGLYVFYRERTVKRMSG